MVAGHQAFRSCITKICELALDGYLKLHFVIRLGKVPLRSDIIVCPVFRSCFSQKHICDLAALRIPF